MEDIKKDRDSWRLLCIIMISLDTIQFIIEQIK